MIFIVTYIISLALATGPNFLFILQDIRREFTISNFPMLFSFMMQLDGEDIPNKGFHDYDSNKVLP